jgi:hypothetical protein
MVTYYDVPRRSLRRRGSALRVGSLEQLHLARREIKRERSST